MNIEPTEKLDPFKDSDKFFAAPFVLDDAGNKFILKGVGEKSSRLIRFEDKDKAKPKSVFLDNSEIRLPETSVPAKKQMGLFEV